MFGEIEDLKLAIVSIVYIVVIKSLLAFECIIVKTNRDKMMIITYEGTYY